VQVNFVKLFVCHHMDPVITKISGPVGTITLNRPQRGNALTTAMTLQLKSALAEFASNVAVRVVVLTGSGKFFCTGMDLGSDNQSKMDENLKQGNAASATIDFFECLKNFPKPLIAKINGPAYGGGWGIIFCCDFRIASNKSHFCLAEVKRGLIPAVISLYIVKEIGTFASKQIMLTGARFAAQRAYEMGLLTSVVDEQNLDKATEELIAELLTSAPGAMRKIKKEIDFVATHSHDDNKKMVQPLFAEMIRDPEAMYGMSCYLQKQTPDWSDFLKEQAKL